MLRNATASDAVVEEVLVPQPRGPKPGPQLAIVDGVGVRLTRSGEPIAKISPPEEANFTPAQLKIWDQFIADNAEIDHQDTPEATIYVRLYDRYLRAPETFNASLLRYMSTLGDKLYLPSAERNRKSGGAAAAPRAGAASKYLSKRS